MWLRQFNYGKNGLQNFSLSVSRDLNVVACGSLSVWLGRICLAAGSAGKMIPATRSACKTAEWAVSGVMWAFWLRQQQAIMNNRQEGIFITLCCSWSCCGTWFVILCYNQFSSCSLLCKCAERTPTRAWEVVTGRSWKCGCQSCPKWSMDKNLLKSWLVWCATFMFLCWVHFFLTLFRRLFVLRHHCCSSAATSRRHCFSHRTLHHNVSLYDRL